MNSGRGAWEAAKRRMQLILWASLILLLFAPVTTGIASSQADPLELQTRAILEKNCMTCHGELQMSGLDMRHREGLLKGGDRGGAVLPGNVEESLLYLAAAHDPRAPIKMPPQGQPLSADDVEVIRKWIDAGAPWGAVSAHDQKRVEPSWWAFKKPRRPPVPEVKGKGWVKNPIDAFILAKLEEKGLRHAPAADLRTLIRRVYFDLIGLPPTPEEVAAFVNDPDPQAYEKLVDQLLDSPHYGERWGRHWLDVVRFAESSGFGLYHRHAWRYRDYVIKSFNEDKPYDQFVQEQIAADELWPSDLRLEKNLYAIPFEEVRHMEARVGTGLYTLGPEIGESRLNYKKLSYETLTDWVDTTGSVFLGLSFGCARCHDHKFDPITQKDYYGMQAIFAGSRKMEIPVVTAMSTFHREGEYPKTIHLDERRKAYHMFEEDVKKRVIEAKSREFPPEVVAAYQVPDKDRTPEQEEMAKPLIEAIEALKLDEKDQAYHQKLGEYMTPEEKEEQQKLHDELVKAVLALPEEDASHRVRYDGLFDIAAASVLGHWEAPELVPQVHVLDRGDLSQPNERALPRLPNILDDGSIRLEDPAELPYVPRNRKKLALWLTRPDHPLTARVMVHRIWLWHFGQGIVRTPNDFGHMGDPPSHPELLDWLAREFVARAWSLKGMHRLMLLSNTYQMATKYSDPEATEVDPENRFLWRMNRWRLEGELLWDALHAVAGTLNLKRGGRSVAPPLTQEELLGREKWEWVAAADPNEYNRRGVYILARRDFLFPLFSKFDVPGPSLSCPKREVTTVAPQALWLMNNRIVYEQAQYFAARLVREQGAEPEAWVERAWQLALGRAPSDRERRDALVLLQPGKAGTDDGHNNGESLPAPLHEIDLAQAQALTELCLVLFNINEFTYVD